MACRVLGRDAVLIEQDGTWAEASRKRLKAPPSPRDRNRIDWWIKRVEEEATAIPEPEDPSQVPTWERAQRRLADVMRAKEFLIKGA